MNPVHNEANVVGLNKYQMRQVAKPRNESNVSNANQRLHGITVVERFQLLTKTIN